jgi:hypothetical protein
MDVQRKLATLADANPARGIPQKALPFIPSPAKQSMPQQVEEWSASAFARRATADKSLRSQ